MITSIVILVFSLAMFVYWFRYSCLLILQSNWNEDQALLLASQKRLSFGAVQHSLAAANSPQGLDLVRDALDRDLKCVLSLLANCPAVREAGQSIECRLLLWDYQFMRLWYRFTRSSMGPRAHDALREMALVVGYLAGECGEDFAPART